MRLPQFALILSVLSGLVLVSVSCRQQTTDRVPQADEDPPVLLEEPQKQPTRRSKKDETELLLLLEEPDEAFSAAGPMADNSRCHVCHMNYEVEELAVTHAKANIGCEKCHGASDAHCSDEDNITPPEIMFPRAKINGSCMTCHPKGRLDIKAHKPVLEALAQNKKVCTDCHGDHRLAHRTRRWDKATGKLIEDDKVRMIEKAPPKK